ncbi:MAG: hypothetical protein D6738_07300, partial [Acidobacteria bacterium]
IEDVDQAGGSAAFVDGARGWSRRALTVRQRLGDRTLLGSNFYLLLGIAETDPVLDAAADGAVSPRLALLDRRRLSGGLALAF